MEREWYLNKHISLHFVFYSKDMFEFDLLPSILISDWRVMFGLFFFRLQITYKPLKNELY